MNKPLIARIAAIIAITTAFCSTAEAGFHFHFGGGIGFAFRHHHGPDVVFHHWIKRKIIREARHAIRRRHRVIVVERPAIATDTQVTSTPRTTSVVEQDPPAAQQQAEAPASDIVSETSSIATAEGTPTDTSDATTESVPTDTSEATVPADEDGNGQTASGDENPIVEPAALEAPVQPVSQPVQEAAGQAAKPVEAKLEQSASKLDCKKFFPSVGMTLTVPCE